MSLSVKLPENATEAAEYDHRWWSGLLLTTHNATGVGRGHHPAFRDQLVADAAISFCAQYLEALATTEHEAVRQVSIRNINGVRLSSAHCPLARMLQRSMREPVITNGYVMRTKRGSMWGQANLPNVWIRFADGFDRGYYPQLVDRREKEGENDGRII